MKVYLRSLGCRLNQSEIEALARQFMRIGHTIVSDPVQADVCVVNTCAVTAEAERKSRHALSALARANPQARIAAIGCYATLAPQVCSTLPGIAWVLPNAEKDGLAERMSLPTDATTPAPDNRLARTRAFVKVQDGCDNRCTYCIVGILRGPSRSRPLGEVVEQVRSLVEAGYREVVLTGVNLGAYGQELGMNSGLRILLETLLEHTDVQRLRLSSVEPWDIDERFFALWEDPRLCRHLHLPLQSGCDELLQRMGRRLTTREYARLVATARATIPELAITTDIIVGFPGEDEAAFRASYEFVAEMAFARLHVFPYSPRPGTPAAVMPGQVERCVMATRAEEFRALGMRLALQFRQQFVGRTLEVLWEHRRADGLWSGLTDNYLRVLTASGRALHNLITAVRLTGVQDGHLTGEVVS
ncbi:MAG: tRNA (N(6)-L-threonylcarbamoyladenosine(37)-C(2))-methylthiotransferase MtaB [Anaerolineae bacterium]|nr:tRNA (N(6)-L-threonylcarbamoyladenosine(37)-C(2))-methylthiotransferase MtaB [Anaerolineae bacterium]